MTHPIPLLAVWRIGPFSLGLPWWILAALLTYWAVVIVLLDSAGRRTRVADAKRVKSWMESAAHPLQVSMR